MVVTALLSDHDNDTDRFTERDGHFWWPKTDKRGRAAITTEVGGAIQWALQHTPNRRCVVQAGGNVGVYPIALSAAFEGVVTVEPDLKNHACLMRNMQDHKAHNIYAQYAAFGAHEGSCHVIVPPGEADNCGAHQILPGGPVDVITIDSIAPAGVDLIWLDVEGYELAALQGAKATIERCSPVIIIEDKGHGPSPHDHLESLGYRLTDHRGNDRLYKRTT